MNEMTLSRVWSNPNPSNIHQVWIGLDRFDFSNILKHFYIIIHLKNFELIRNNNIQLTFTLIIYIQLY